MAYVLTTPTGLPLHILALVQKAKGDGYLRSIGVEVRTFMRSFYFALNTLSPHKPYPNGLGKRTNYWAEAARQTAWSVEGNAALVTVNQPGIASRQKAQTITPKNKKYLTVPAIAEAHGRVASDFGNLRYVEFHKKDGSIARALMEGGPKGATKGQSGKRVPGLNLYRKLTGHHWRVYFWLVKAVNIKADPGAFPDWRDVAMVARQAVMNYFAKA